MKVKFFATYRGITGVKETDVTAPQDVWELLMLLGERYGASMRGLLFTPDGADIGVNAIVLINGRSITHLNGRDTLLSETDVVCVFPMVAGG